MIKFIRRQGTRAGIKLRRQRIRFFKHLRGYLLTGIVISMPFVLTLAFAKWMIDFFDEKVTPFLPQPYADLHFFPGIGILVLVVALTLIGALTAGILGRAFFGFVDKIMHSTPILRIIYTTLKQIFQTALSEKSMAFRQTVLIEYPRRDCWAMAFVTNELTGETQKKVKENLVCVFVPTTPNPTSGFLLFYPKKDLVELEMTPENAIKLIISGGILQPEQKNLEQKSLEQKKITPKKITPKVGKSRKKKK